MKVKNFTQFMVLGVAFSLLTLAHISAASTDDADEAGADRFILQIISKDYAALEREYEKYLDLYVNDKIPEEELASKFSAFEKTSGLEVQLNEWVSRYPQSYAARLARGTYLIAEAWRRRGDKLAAETSKEQFQQFHATLEKARGDVETSLKLFARPVGSYRLLIRASKGLSARDSLHSLLDAALKLDPRAYSPRLEYLTAITPKWGGSVDLMAQFLAESNTSALREEDKSRLKGEYYGYLGEQSLFRRHYKSASSLFLKAYEASGNPHFLYRSGKAALDEGLIDMAFARFDTLTKAHSNMYYGFTQRGLLYENHFKDYEKALNDYFVAANLGNSWAQNRLGWWYMNGTHVGVDLDKAEEFFKRAAAQRNGTAIENLHHLEKLRRKIGAPT